MKIYKNNDFDHKNLLNQINITPFVDVMLVLLIVFMIASPMLVGGIDVDLPKTKLEATKNSNEPLTITINSKGEIFLLNTRILLQNLEKKCKQIIKNKKDSRVIIKGDKKLDYGKVMEIVSILNQAGYDKVSLITDIITQ